MCLSGLNFIVPEESKFSHIENCTQTFDNSGSNVKIILSIDWIEQTLDKILCFVDHFVL